MEERKLISFTTLLVEGIKNLSASRQLLLSVLRPTIEYGNKSQASALESITLGGAKKILGCLSRTCNEAVRRTRV